MEASVRNADIDALRSLAASITADIDKLENCSNASAETAVLRSISHRASKLKAVSTPANDAYSDFTLRPLANACVRIAISLKLFDHLPPDGAGRSLEQIAQLVQADEQLLLRILRGLVAFDVIKLDDATGLYSHTAMSLIYAQDSQRSWAVWMWDVMIASATGGIGPYFDSRDKPIENPPTAERSPFSLHHNSEGMNIFEIVEKLGKLPLLNSAMSGSSIVCGKQAVESYDFGAIRPGADGVTLVDVGGAKGQTILEIRTANPGIEGRLILQDLQSVIEDGAVPGLDVEVMSYDFFKEEQPVKGASAYLYQRIFHDWGDESCARILDSLRPAMTADSRLLICDVVVQDHEPHPKKVLRDLNMLLVGGLERSQSQWTSLLESSGFVIEKFHGVDSPDNSIIEARLAG